MSWYLKTGEGDGDMGSGQDLQELCLLIRLSRVLSSKIDMGPHKGLVVCS